MQLGMIGLGRMGGNMVERLMARGHQCVVHDRSTEAVSRLAAAGATGAGSTAEFVAKMSRPRHIWLMIPAGIVDAALAELVPHLAADDVVIDGGNSYYIDDIRRAKELAAKGIHYLDVGTSGGVYGKDRGYCLMIGGNDAAVTRLDPIFAALSPGVEAAPRTPGKSGDPSTAERGYLHCGPAGAGHFVKMVHNGIEYGLMAAYAEGLAILQHANVGDRSQVHDAETAPLRNPEYYQYKLDVPAVAEVWRRGSVVGSWLLDLAALALSKDPQLGAFAGRVSDSGEGRWTVQAAVETGTPAHVLTAALYERFSSRGEADYADKLLSALRAEFGGHAEKSHG